MMEILYLGPYASHSHGAAKTLFPKGAFKPAATYEEMFAAIDANENSLAIIPIETTFGGDVYTNFEKLFHGNYKIISEIYLKLSHNFLIHPKSKIEDIKTLYIDYETRKQCSKFLMDYPHFQTIIVNSASEGAKIISDDEDTTAATISGPGASYAYNLKVEKEDVGDEADNFTRYVSIATDLFDFPPGSSNKCSIVFEVPNIPGGLVKVLDILYKNDYNLSKIESRPIANKPWSTKIFIDFTFYKVLELADFEKAVENMKIVGIYEQGSKLRER
jgi:chorismate mutase/prephenate dehydratase